jgi:hypothetical protein
MANDEWVIFLWWLKSSSAPAVQPVPVVSTGYLAIPIVRIFN